ncbi:MAG: hypothetical protein K2N22_01825 [Clostridia bacterium]|nr:hypothetical protein [Clostridia bacterium]
MKEQGEIILTVSIPGCAACMDRIENLLMRMGCWEKVSFGYPTECGTAVYMFYDKNNKEIDYRRKAKEAREILEGSRYYVI